MGGLSALAASVPLLGTSSAAYCYGEPIARRGFYEETRLP